MINTLDIVTTPLTSNQEVIYEELHSMCTDDVWILKGHQLRRWSPIRDTVEILDSPVGNSFDIAGFDLESDSLWGYHHEGQGIFQATDNGHGLQFNTKNIQRGPGSYRPNVGDVYSSGSGSYLVSASSAQWMSIALNEDTLDSVQEVELHVLGSSVQDAIGGDIAFSPDGGGEFYSVTDGTSLTRGTYDVEASSITLESLGMIFSSTDRLPLGRYGAQFFDQNGKLYFLHDRTGRLFRLDESGRAQYVQESASGIYNSAARCPTAEWDIHDIQLTDSLRDPMISARHFIPAQQLFELPYSYQPFLFHELIPGLVNHARIHMNFMRPNKLYVNVFINWEKPGEFEGPGVVTLARNMVISKASDSLPIDVPFDALSGVNVCRVRMSERPIRGRTPWRGPALGGHVIDVSIVVKSYVTSLEPCPSLMWVMKKEDDVTSVVEYDPVTGIIKRRSTLPTLSSLAYDPVVSLLVGFRATDNMSVIRVGLHEDSLTIDPVSFLVADVGGVAPMKPAASSAVCNLFEEGVQASWLVAMHGGELYLTSLHLSPDGSLLRRKLEIRGNAPLLPTYAIAIDQSSSPGRCLLYALTADGSVYEAVLDTHTPSIVFSRRVTAVSFPSDVGYSTLMLGPQEEFMALDLEGRLWMSPGTFVRYGESVVVGQVASAVGACRCAAARFNLRGMTFGSAPAFYHNDFYSDGPRHFDRGQEAPLMTFQEIIRNWDGESLEHNGRRMPVVRLGELSEAVLVLQLDRARDPHTDTFFVNVFVDWSQQFSFEGSQVVANEVLPFPVQRDTIALPIALTPPLDARAGVPVWVRARVSQDSINSSLPWRGAAPGGLVVDFEVYIQRKLEPLECSNDALVFSDEPHGMFTISVPKLFREYSGTISAGWQMRYGDHGPLRLRLVGFDYSSGYYYATHHRSLIRIGASQFDSTVLDMIGSSFDVVDIDTYHGGGIVRISDHTFLMLCRNYPLECIGLDLSRLSSSLEGPQFSRVDITLEEGVSEIGVAFDFHPVQSELEASAFSLTRNLDMIRLDVTLQDNTLLLSAKSLGVISGRHGRKFDVDGEFIMQNFDVDGNLYATHAYHGVTLRCPIPYAGSEAVECDSYAFGDFQSISSGTRCNRASITIEEDACMVRGAGVYEDTFGNDARHSPVSGEDTWLGSNSCSANTPVGEQSAVVPVLIVGKQSTLGISIAGELKTKYLNGFINWEDGLTDHILRNVLFVSDGSAGQRRHSLMLDVPPTASLGSRFIRLRTSAFPLPSQSYPINGGMAGGETETIEAVVAEALAPYFDELLFSLKDGVAPSNVAMTIQNRLAGAVQDINLRFLGGDFDSGLLWGVVDGFVAQFGQSRDGLSSFQAFECENLPRTLKGGSVLYREGKMSALIILDGEDQFWSLDLGLLSTPLVLDRLTIAGPPEALLFNHFAFHPLSADHFFAIGNSMSAANLLLRGRVDMERSEVSIEEVGVVLVRDKALISSEPPTYSWISDEGWLFSVYDEIHCIVSVDVKDPLRPDPLHSYYAVHSSVWRGDFYQRNVGTIRSASPQVYHESDNLPGHLPDPFGWDSDVWIGVDQEDLYVPELYVPILIADQEHHIILYAGGPALDAIAYLNVFIDWNKSGDFDGPEDHVVVNLMIHTQEWVQVPITVPAETRFGHSWSRLRVSSHELNADAVPWQGLVYSGDIVDANTFVCHSLGPLLSKRELMLIAVIGQIFLDTTDEWNEHLSLPLDDVLGVGYESASRIGYGILSDNSSLVRIGVDVSGSLQSQLIPVVFLGDPISVLCSDVMPHEPIMLLSDGRAKYELIDLTMMSTPVHIVSVAAHSLLVDVQYHSFSFHPVHYNTLFTIGTVDGVRNTMILGVLNSDSIEVFSAGVVTEPDGKDLVTQGPYTQVQMNPEGRMIAVDAETGLVIMVDTSAALEPVLSSALYVNHNWSPYEELILVEEDQHHHYEDAAPTSYLQGFGDKGPCHRPPPEEYSIWVDYLEFPRLLPGIEIEVHLKIGGTASGYLNLFVDMYSAGNFWRDHDAHVLVNHPIVGGKTEMVKFDLPANVVDGHTWSRFRVSTQPIIPEAMPYTGCCLDGEVIDRSIFIEALLSPLFSCDIVPIISAMDQYEFHILGSGVQGDVVYGSDITAVGCDDFNLFAYGFIPSRHQFFIMGLKHGITFLSKVRVIWHVASGEAEVVAGDVMHLDNSSYLVQTDGLEKYYMWKIGEQEQVLLDHYGDQHGPIVDLVFHPYEVNVFFAISSDEEGLNSLVRGIVDHEFHSVSTEVVGQLVNVSEHVKGPFNILRMDAKGRLSAVDVPSALEIRIDTSDPFNPDLSQIDTITHNFNVNDEFTLLSKVEQADFGGAPLSYQVDNGGLRARHVFLADHTTLWLGEEAPDADRPGEGWSDNLEGADELPNDGVSFPIFFGGETRSAVVKVNGIHAGEDGYLNVFVDWFDSGSFQSAHHAVENEKVSVGSTALVQVNPPPLAPLGRHHARIRLSPLPLIPDAAPWAASVVSGEVEDHVIVVADHPVPIDDCSSLSWFSSPRGNLSMIDLSTGSTSVGPKLSVDDLDAHGYDLVTGTIWGSNSQLGNLFQIYRGQREGNLKVQYFDAVTDDREIFSAFAGDVFYHRHKSYLLQSDGKFTYYATDLTLSSTPVIQQRITYKGKGDEMMGDFAFHPTQSGIFYTIGSDVKNSNVVFSGKVDMDTLEVNVAVVGQLSHHNLPMITKGAFNAVWFDEDGLFYGFNELTGIIIRVDVTDPESMDKAEYFAYSKSVKVLDGSRCPMSKLDWVDVDLGDAKDFDIGFQSNGPRHAVREDSALWIGPVKPDADQDKQLDDNEKGVVDEKRMVMDWLLPGDTLKFKVQVDGPEDRVRGYLNVFIDWFADGEFSSRRLEKHVVVNQKVFTSVTYDVSAEVPLESAKQEIWVRVRLSADSLNDEGAPWSGGTSDGEVEDFRIRVGEAAKTPPLTVNKVHTKTMEDSANKFGIMSQLNVVRDDPSVTVATKRLGVGYVPQRQPARSNSFRPNFPRTSTFAANRRAVPPPVPRTSTSAANRRAVPPTVMSSRSRLRTEPSLRYRINKASS
eukprot:GHVH01002132.1.p1 GENE.GHVH01002132.1~~GHVH01002132.1.p1  ORF type:complete len:3052 (+),score=417.93 GHVH01002132.1:132-9287(+)